MTRGSARRSYSMWMDVPYQLRAGYNCDNWLADFSAKGIWNSLKACFASPRCRPEELKHLVISEQQFARKCVGLVADGATVNGLQQQDTKRGTRIKVPIEYSKEGDNVFHYVSECRKDFSEAKPIGADIRQSLFLHLNHACVE